MRIVTIAGARPNFVKVAALTAEMRKFHDLETIFVHTGQHTDPEMSESLMQDLEIPRPDFRLRISQANRLQRLREMRTELAEVMRRARPDLALVVGDVDSTVAGALAAYELRIPVAHVEAGLRSFDRGMPEEANRIITDSISSLFFASEPSAVENLLAEGCPPTQVFLSGNVMIDTLRRFCLAARESEVLEKLGLAGKGGRPKRYVLATLHRPGTVDHPATLRNVWMALEAIADYTPVIFCAHPRTRSRLELAGVTGAQEGRGERDRARVIPPQRYTDFLRLESDAVLVLTDSGGVQEETTALGVPCVTLRNNTERPITLTQGTNRLAGLDPANIVRAARQALSATSVPRPLPPLWDGRSAQRIVGVLRRHAALLETLPPYTAPLSAAEARPLLVPSSPVLPASSHQIKF